MNGFIFKICLGWLIFIPFCVIAADRNPDLPGDTAMTASALSGEIISAYAEFTSAVEQTMLTVPADKHFVLTDMIGSAFLEIKEERNRKDKVTKLKVQLGYSSDQNMTCSNQISLRTGIVFNPGTEVVAYPYMFGKGLDATYGYITLSGYFY